MHDVLEGALELEMKQLLKLYVGRKSLRLSTLNDAIESFPYIGADATNKPSPISSKTLTSQDNLLKQSGKCTIRLSWYSVRVHVHAWHCMYNVYCYPYSITAVVFGQTTTTVYWRADWRRRSPLGELSAYAHHCRLLFCTTCIWGLGCISTNDH